MDDELHLRIAAQERGHRLRQGVARLSMGGGDGERPHLVVRELLACAAQVLRFRQDALGNVDGGLAGLGQRDEPLAMAHEYLDAELVLERADLLGNTWLRRMQGRRRLGDVEAAPHDFSQVAKLLELHDL